MTPLQINGWSVYFHPAFARQLEALVEKVEALSQSFPDDYRKKSATKRLAAILDLVVKEIPTDPKNAAYRQGMTLGAEHKHWFRAKFFQQYRLYFRFHESSKVIIIGWVNDDTTLRAYGSKTDAYKVFSRLLKDGNPPTEWAALLKGAKEGEVDIEGAFRAIGAEPGVEFAAAVADLEARIREGRN